MQLFLYLMTTSVILIMKNDGIQLMSLLDGSFLECSNCTTASSGNKLKQDRNTASIVLARYKNTKTSENPDLDILHRSKADEEEQRRIRELWDPVLNQSLQVSLLENYGKEESFKNPRSETYQESRLGECCDPVYIKSSPCESLNQTCGSHSDQNTTTTIEDFNSTLPNTETSCNETERSNFTNSTEPAAIQAPFGKILFRSQRRSPIVKYPLKVNLFLTRRPLFGKIYTVLATMPSLGNENFVLKLTVDTEDYLIDEIVTKPDAKNTGWKYTYNLKHILRRKGILQSRLPYTHCYVYRTRATFYNPRHKYVIARVSSALSSKLLASEVHRKIKVRRPPDMSCLPELGLNYCSDPNMPVEIPPQQDVQFHVVINGDCDDIKYKHIRWDFYDTREKNLLAHVGVTKGTIFRLPAYKVYETRDLFMLRACARVNDVLTVARCYVKYVPPKLDVRIYGNERRKADVRKELIIDGSNSKDTHMETQTIESKTFLWSCRSLDDATNTHCRLDMSTSPIIRLPENSLKADCLYDFSLTMSLRRDPSYRETASQVVRGIATDTFTPHISCRRNCKLNTYAARYSVHLSALCINCKEKVVQYEWWVAADDDEPILESQKKFLILRHQEDTLLIRLKLVLKSQLSAIAVYTLYRNLGPQSGNCVIWPLVGIEAVTLFKINCLDFQSPYGPITFRYKVPMGAIITGLRYKKYSTILPKTDRLTIIICDIYDTCVTQELKVDVLPFQLKDPRADTESHIQEVIAGVPYMLERGHWYRSFAKCLAATQYMTSAHHGRLIYSALSKHDIVTASQLEKLTSLAVHLMRHMMPIDYKGASLLQSVFNQISHGFEVAVSNRIRLDQDAYDSLTTMYMFFISVLGTTSEMHSMAMCRPIDPACLNMRMLEEKQRFSVQFDPLILIRKNIWMMNTWHLYLCVYYLGFLAAKRHYPHDEAMTVSKGGIAYQVNVTEVMDPIEAITLKTIDNIHEMQISAALLSDLSKRLNHTSILFQVVSQQNHHNIFWWFPDPMPTKTSVLLLHVFSPTKFFETAYEHHLKHPVVYKTNVTEFSDDPVFNKWMLNGSILNDMEVHYYSLKLDIKAMLAVRIVSCSEPMHVNMRLHKRPTAKELRNGTCFITPQMNGKRIWMGNFCGRSKAFVSLYRSGDYQLAHPTKRDRRHAHREHTGHSEPLNYSILLEIYQCNVWMNRSLDPGWSPDFCETTFQHSYGTSVQCTCHILGSLASRIFPISSEQYVDVIPLPILALKVTMVLAFLILFVLLVTILALSTGTLSAYQRQQHFLQCHGGKIRMHGEQSDTGDILIVVVTGGQEFAGTTSNVKIYLKSPGKKQTSYQITQDPGHPRLLRNTTNKLLVPRGSIYIPTRLALSIERNGRYPSWYCRTVTVVDLELKRQHMFVIERWIEPGHTRFMRSKYFSIGDHRSTPRYTWWKRFRNRFEQFNIGWFMGNPITGPWENSIAGWSMNRFERSSVFISKIAITLTLVSVYFGSSSAEDIQEEQRISGDRSIEFQEVAVLSFYGFIIGCFVHFFFEIVILRWIWIKR